MHGIKLGGDAFLSTDRLLTYLVIVTWTDQEMTDAYGTGHGINTQWERGKCRWQNWLEKSQQGCINATNHAASVLHITL